MSIPEVLRDPPVLRTERLLMRQITESDGEGLFAIFADDQVTEHYAWDTFTSIGPGHELAARTAAQSRQQEAIRWGLLLPDSPHIIGTCGYTRWNQENHFAVLGYDLARPYWRRGLMSEAVTAVQRLGFEQTALHRVEATVMAGNTASAAVLTRAGFQREAYCADAPSSKANSGTCRSSVSPGRTGLRPPIRTSPESRQLVAPSP